MCDSLRFLAFLGLSALLGGCSTPSVNEDISEEFAAEGLHAVTSSGFREAYVKPDAGLADYRAVTIEPMDLDNVDIPNTNVSGTVRGDWQITPEREQRLQQSWESSMNRAFSDYLEDDGAGRKLVITSALTQVRARTGTIAANAAVPGTQPVPGMGSNIVDIHGEFRMSDAESGDLLAVVRDVRTLSANAWTRTAGSDMASLFNTWAGLLHTRVSGR